jgi:hypothetical protein
LVQYHRSAPPLCPYRVRQGLCTRASPDIELREGRRAPLQEPRHTHTQFLIVQRHLSHPARADRDVLLAAVERRERRDPLQRVGHGGPARDAQLILPASQRERERPSATDSLSVSPSAPFPPPSMPSPLVQTLPFSPSPLLLHLPLSFHPSLSPSAYSSLKWLSTPDVI